jgi:uncharacterized RDD family membrane protein YckC
MPYCKNCGYELPERSQFCPKCGTAVAKEEARVVVGEAVAPAAQIEPGLKLALWWERFVAWLIDVVLIGAILGALTILGGQSLSLIPGWPDWLPFFSFNLNGVVLFLYWMLLEGVYGQSLGKWVMRIKVTRLDGGPVDMGRAALESLGKAFLLLLDCLLGWILYPRRRQRIFNYISETIVIKVT